ncbi:MAG TPA: MG2 domain-containing protein [Anaerolineae bacterium]|nr:MG2 domain-containing protein [Anaerolineae bacterium]
MTDLHVEPDLLAYLDGELNAADRARVDAHLARCPACAARLDELRVLRRDLDATLDAALTPVRLSRAADQAIRETLRARLERPRWWEALWARRGILVQAAMAVLLIVFSLNVGAIVTPAGPPAAQETLVFGQERLAPGGRAALRVIVRRADSALPLAGTEVLVSLVKASGLAQQVYAGRTDARGTADVAFMTPEDFAGDAELVVETRSDIGSKRLARPIVIARAYKLYLSPDKPAYRPGQTVHLRALALDAVTLKPATDGELTFNVINAAGRTIARHARPLSEFGVASADAILAADAPPGTYTLRATLGDTVSERTVTVGDYTLPPFRVSFETDRAFSRPGDRVTVRGAAAYFHGAPVAQGTVTLRATAESADTPFLELTGQTDAEGAFAFTFALPTDLGQATIAQLELAVSVADAAGPSAGLRKLLPVSSHPLIIKAVPESGHLKPGVENVVYVLTAYPDGTPVSADLTAMTDIYRFTLTTDAYGLGSFTYVPRAGGDMGLVGRTPDGFIGATTLSLDADAAAQVVLLRAEKAAYEVGETLRLQAFTTAGVDALYLDVLHAQQTVAVLSAPVTDGQATFALDLDAALVGALELHAYFVPPDGKPVEDTRLVVVDMPQRVAVAVTADQPTYAPGDVAQVHIQTALVTQTSSLSAPVQSALGIAVVDESVYALDTLPPGFARAYFLLEDALTASAVVDAPADARAAQDMAARAAWAGAPTVGYSLQAYGAMSAPDSAAAARRALAGALSGALVVLPALLALVVARGLSPLGLLGQALRRLGIGLLVMFVLSPLLLVGGVLGVLVPLLGMAALVGVLALVALLLMGLLLHGWLRRDVPSQLVAGLLAGYLVLGGALVVLAARGADLPGWLLALLVAAFLGLAGALALWGQGLALAGRRAVGWLTTALALLLLVLAVLLPAFPRFASDFTRALGAPGLYAGPLGWLSGCAVPRPQAIQKTVEVEKVVEKTEEIEVTSEPTKAPEATKPPAAATEVPTAAPEPTAMPKSTVTPAPLPPVETYPLRTLLPETLYWNPAAVTDVAGRFAFELPLPDLSTTWRVTVLASTLDGDIGAATQPIAVVPPLSAE